MKTILIVGGSKGIGQAVLQNFVSYCKIINISRTTPYLSHENITHYPCDILTQDLPDLEYADGLIYCPGSINLKPISRLSLEDFRNDFEINVLGAVRVIQKYLPLLRNGIKPSILLFSSVAATLGMPFHASIATAKSGIEGLVKTLGAELAPNIRVNAIAPTITHTELASKVLRNEKTIDNITQRHPLKKFLNPREVAHMVEFLISDKAASISGQVLKMDCGIVSFKI